MLCCSYNLDRRLFDFELKDGPLRPKPCCFHMEQHDVHCDLALTGFKPFAFLRDVQYVFVGPTYLFDAW